MDYERLCEIFDALEDLRFLKPVYLAVLKKTGDKQQAMDAVLYVKKMIDEGKVTLGGSII